MVEGARLEIVLRWQAVLGFKSLTLRHIKYQLLIQRLVLFFYPMAAQKPLWQRVFRHFLEKASRDNHHFDHANRRGRQNRFPRLYFFTPFQSKWHIFEFYQMVYLELLSPPGLLGYFLRVSVSTYREGRRGQDGCFSARNGLGRHRRNAERRENCRRIEIGIRPSEWIKESCFL